MELSGYVAIVRRWWWTLLVATWVAGLSGFIVASQIPPTYESRAELLVGPINTDADTLRASGQLVQTYAQISTTEPLLASAIQELGLSIEPADLAVATRATANDVTRILTIRVQSADSEQAALLANTLADELVQLASRGISRPEGELQVIEFARPAEQPVAPQVSLLVALAAGAGLIGAIVLVLLVEYLSDVVRTREDLVHATGGAFLGSIQATGGNDPEAELRAMAVAPQSEVGRAYQLVAAKIILGTGERTLSSVLVIDVTSTAAGAVVAANLTRAMTRLGRRPVLVDGAGPAGLVSRQLGIEDRPGAFDVLAGSADAASVRAEVGGLTAIGGGRTTLERMDRDACRRFIDGQLGDRDLVVVTAPPIHESAATAVWARACDGAILVAQRDVAKRNEVAFEAESLGLVGSDLVGVALRERGRALRGPARQRTSLPVAMEPLLSSRPPADPSAESTGEATVRAPVEVETEGRRPGRSAGGPAAGRTGQRRSRVAQATPMAKRPDQAT